MRADEGWPLNAAGHQLFTSSLDTEAAANSRLPVYPGFCCQPRGVVPQLLVPVLLLLQPLCRKRAQNKKDTTVNRVTAIGSGLCIWAGSKKLVVAGRCAGTGPQNTLKFGRS